MQIPTERDAQRTQPKHKQSTRDGDVDCDVGADVCAAAWATLSAKVAFKGFVFFFKVKYYTYDDIHTCMISYQSINM